MADNTILNPGVGGDTISDEDLGAYKIPRGKIVTGAHGVDGGDVAITNPLPVELSDGTQALGVTGNPLQVAGTITTTPSGTQPVSGTVAVSNFPGTQAVSGTVTANVGTTGALALDATLTGGSQKTQVTDGTNTIGTSAHPVRVDPTGTTTQPVSGSVSVSNLPGTQPVSGTVTSNQGTAAALAGAWPVEVTDGTHTQPTGDAVARSIAVQINDGTNVLGTSSHPVRVDPVGTTTQPVSGSVTATVSGTATVTQGTAAALGAAWPVEVTDGTHTLPTGDAVARSINVQINDGTNVLGTSAHPVRIDPVGTTTQPVSGTVTANAGTGSFTVAQATASNLLAEVGGLGAAGSAVVGNPVQVGGKDPSGNAQALSQATDKSLLVSLGNDQQLVLTNSNVAASGSAVYTGIGHKELNLDINVSGTVTGTTPTLTFTLQEVDPQNTGTALGTSVTGAAIIATGTQTLQLTNTTTGAVKVSWTIAGTATPTFNGVYVTLSIKPTESVQEQFAAVAEDNANGVIAVVSKPLAVGTYSPSFSSGVGTLPGNIKTTSGNIFGLFASNANAAARYLCIFNSAAAPTGTPLASFLIPIAGSVSLGDLFTAVSGINLSTGITLGISTSATTYTAATGTDHAWAISFK